MIRSHAVVVDPKSAGLALRLVVEAHLPPHGDQRLRLRQFAKAVAACLAIVRFRGATDGSNCVMTVQKADTFVVLLAGGDKSTQEKDLRQAKVLAQDLQEPVMPKTFTTPWDAANHLQSEEDMAAYLEAVLKEGDSNLVAAALGDIARAKSMRQVAREAGLGRESLYKALSPAGKPEFATILKVVAALGLQLHASPVNPKNAV